MSLSHDLHFQKHRRHEALAAITISTHRRHRNRTEARSRHARTYAMGPLGPETIAESSPFRLLCMYMYFQHSHLAPLHPIHPRLIDVRGPEDARQALRSLKPCPSPPAPQSLSLDDDGVRICATCRQHVQTTAGWDGRLSLDLHLPPWLRKGRVQERLCTAVYLCPWPFAQPVQDMWRGGIM